MSQAPAWGWGSPIVIGLLVAAAVIVAVWVTVESRSANPLINMKMMRIREVWAANLLALLMGVGMYAAFGFLPQFLQTPASAGYGFGASVTESGLMLLPVSVGMFALGLASGRLATRLGSKNLLVAGSIVSAVGYFVVALRHEAEVDIHLAMSLVGIGFGLAFSAMSNVCRRRGATGTGRCRERHERELPHNRRRAGGGLPGHRCRRGGILVGVPPESGYTYGFLMLGVVLGLGAVAAPFIPAKPTRSCYERVRDAEAAVTIPTMRSSVASNPMWSTRKAPMNCSKHSDRRTDRRCGAGHMFAGRDTDVLE